ncbi:hypothetical protein GCM10009710_06570 [Aeromicrobium alkaliterrae]|uniref:LPXTG cell wall anchor domain-containing protein n=2 Tax=Aeromicrobium alkaliterrae TaxID=302168 RepID=A0ABP4VMY6_9ACTN
MRRSVAASIALLLLVAVPSAAAAQDTRIGLSRDGVTWTGTLASPLFDPDFHWVPGDEQVRTFYVRNESVDPAVLSVEVLGSTSDSLVETGDLTISARGGDGPWHDVSTPGNHTLVSEVGAASGQPRRVDVAVAFDPTSTNPSQVRQLDLDLRVTLRQDGVGGSGSGSLPTTGGPAAVWAVIGLFLIALGIATTRTRQKENHHV